MLLDYFTSLISIMERTALIYYRFQLGRGEYQRFVVHVELRRCLRHQTNNGPATTSI